ncbi:hypothetical protein P5673_028482 [Acropora cervicornis]|uniref:Uncharacterized protein n=1 Tax=Acropora cervicornis TaxID=6130 RepID=A0AAD9UV46_ACRCE|nr:hypothetical protein P5673_028482 [Acropora cervicornis]
MTSLEIRPLKGQEYSLRKKPHLRQNGFHYFQQDNYDKLQGSSFYDSMIEVLTETALRPEPSYKIQDNYKRSCIL